MCPIIQEVLYQANSCDGTVLRYLGIGGVNKSPRHTMYLPRESEVCHVEAVPGGVLEEVVAAGAVVDEDHESDADAAERVERAEALLLLGRRIRIGTLLLQIIALLVDVLRRRRRRRNVEAHRPLEVPPFLERCVESAPPPQAQDESHDHP